MKSQVQERAGVRHRWLHRPGRRPDRVRRLAPRRPRRRPTPLRGQGGDRLRRQVARQPGEAAAGYADGRASVHARASKRRRRTLTGSARNWWRRWSSPSGPGTVASVIPVSKDCGRTSPQPTSSRRCPCRQRSCNGVSITHPNRVFWPTPGVTKRDLVEYYDLVAERMLPYVSEPPDRHGALPERRGGRRGRVRQKRGRPGGCFFHKHPAEDFPGPVGRVMITESGGPAPYLTITGPGSLTALAQMGVLEIHVWGCTWPDIERPDMVVFDLDPGPGRGVVGPSPTARARCARCCAPCTWRAS